MYEILIQLVVNVSFIALPIFYLAGIYTTMTKFAKKLIRSTTWDVKTLLKPNVGECLTMFYYTCKTIKMQQSKER